MNIILACTKDGGIGLKNGEMAWNCKEELNLFKEITSYSVVIVGRETYEKLPELKNRVVICLSTRDKVEPRFEHHYCMKSLFDALNFCKDKFPDKEVYVCGGKKVYDFALGNSCYFFIKKLFISFMKQDYECDVKIDMDFLKKWGVTEKYTERENFESYVLLKKNSEEDQYLDLLRDVYTNGNLKEGRNGLTYSAFVKHLQFDLKKGFPLLTTKKMFFRGIVEELLFFLRGETNSKILEDKNVNIWKGNTDRSFLDSLGMFDREEGLMGPMYGYQWRHFNAEYDEKTGKPKNSGIDQLKHVIESIRTDKNSRRILMTDYNPCQNYECVLYPCHSIILHFYVDSEDKLSMFCYNRSQDLFLGTPFNIASSALLLTIIAKITGLNLGVLSLTLGDCHIYMEHVDAIETQFQRIPYSFPSLRFDKELKNIEDIETLTLENFVLQNYESYDSIKAKMVA